MEIGPDIEEIFDIMDSPLEACIAALGFIALRLVMLPINFVSGNSEWQD